MGTKFVYLCTRNKSSILTLSTMIVRPMCVMSGTLRSFQKLVMGSMGGKEEEYVDICEKIRQNLAPLSPELFTKE